MNSFHVLYFFLMTFPFSPPQFFPLNIFAFLLLHTNFLPKWKTSPKSFSTSRRCLTYSMCFLWTHKKKVRKQPNVIWYEQTAELVDDHNSRNETKLCRLRRFPFSRSQPTLLLFCFTTVVVCFGVLCFFYDFELGMEMRLRNYFDTFSYRALRFIGWLPLDVIVHSIVLAILMDLLWLREAATLFPCTVDFPHLYIDLLYEYAKSKNLYAKSYIPFESDERHFGISNSSLFADALVWKALTTFSMLGWKIIGQQNERERIFIFIKWIFYKRCNVFAPSMLLVECLDRAPQLAGWRAGFSRICTTFSTLSNVLSLHSSWRVREWSIERGHTSSGREKMNWGKISLALIMMELKLKCFWGENSQEICELVTGRAEFL